MHGRTSVPLGKLSKLMGIDIDDNKISGTIPLALGELVNLESLSLDNAKLSGTVPPELGVASVALIKREMAHRIGLAQIPIDKATEKISSLISAGTETGVPKGRSLTHL